MNHFILQLYKDDCGFACLKMLLSYLYNNENYLFLPNPRKEGYYSFLELKERARGYGVTLEGYKNVDITKIKKKELPVIAQISQNGKNHLVLVKRIIKDMVEYHDPLFGTIKMKISVFNETYSYCILKVTHFQEKVPLKIRKSLPFYQLSFPIYMFSYSLFIICGFFVYKEQDILMIAISFLLAFIFLLISRFVNLKDMCRFDKKVISTRHLPKKINADCLKTFTDYKIMKTTTKQRYLTNISSIMLIALLLYFNEYQALVLIPLILLGSILIVAIQRRSKETANKELTIKEMFLQEKFDYNGLLGIEHVSNRYFYKSSFHNVLKHIIILGLTLLLGHMYERFTLNFLLFYLMIYEVLFDEMQKIMMQAFAVDERRQLINRFNSL